MQKLGRRRLFNTVLMISMGCAFTSTALADESWTTGTKTPGDYSASGVITIDGSVSLDPGTYTFDSLVVSASQTLTAKGDTGGNSGVVINANNITINGILSANGEGYSDGGTGAGQTSYQAGGAGYGGAGGQGTTGSAGVSYGLMFSPTDLGSSGGGATTGTQPKGGRGGGAIKLIVSGTLQVEGALSANGNNGSSPGGGGGSGGGSGGSLWIVTNTLSGAMGVITADGGNGGSFAGGGGGGRIAIYYGSSNYTGATSVAGGTKGTGSFGNTSTGGQSGSIFIMDTSTDELVCSSATELNLTSGLPSPLVALNISGGCKVTVPEITSIGNITVSGANSELNLAGNLTTTSVASINITSQGTLRVLSDPLTETGYTISTADIYIGTNSKLIADGTGYTNGEGPGGAVMSYEAGGGGYGGAGGQGTTDAGGGVYGSIFNPTHLGSSGGPNDSGVQPKGGHGGGAIKLIVSGTLQVEGILSANGDIGLSSSNAGSGGGSGGSLWIVTNTLSGSTGAITSNGGNGGSYAGGGGGGRIAIYYGSSSYTGTMSVTGGARGTGSFGNTSTGGQSGSIFIMDTSTDELVCNSATELNLTSGLPSPLAALNISGGCKVTVPEVASIGDISISGTGSTLTITGNLTTTVTAGIDLTSSATLVVGTNWITKISNTLTTNSLTVDSTSIITADFLGETSGHGLGAGSEVSGSGSGAGHGGRGGSASGSSSQPGGAIYGDVFKPVNLGSGGGPASGNLGGTGGGAIKLVVSNLQLDGVLSAKGGNGLPSSGGGSGGSIWIVGGTLSGGGQITVAGGKGGSYAGGGAGGRILVSYLVNNLTGISTWSVAGGAKGGSSGTHTAGDSGSILFVDQATNTVVIAADLTLPSGAYSFENILVTNNATLTLKGNTSTGQGVLLSASNISVDAGAKISADGQGYPQDSGPGAGIDGAGGSYGGKGGTTMFTGPAGSTYGSEQNPIDLGSGGGSFTSVGGSGGGAIKIVAGKLTLNGDISANGLAGGSAFGYGGGGGSGGSLWLSVGTFEGNGALAAKGGAPGSNAGGGGGGRIALYTVTNNFSGSVSVDKAGNGVVGTYYNMALGPPVKVLFTQTPAIGQAGLSLPIQPQVSVVDSNGNTIPNSTDSITLEAFTDSACSVSATGTLDYSATATFTGMAWFSDVSYSEPGDIYIKALSGSLDPDCSSLVQIGGVATKLVFVTEPSATAIAAVNFSQQPVVEVVDENGFKDYLQTEGVSLAVFSDAACTVPLSGNLTGSNKTPSMGVASFTGVSFNKTGTIYLKASSGSLETDCSSAIEVEPGPATRLVYVTEPSTSATAGLDFAQQPIIEARDASNNVATDFSGTVSFKAYTNSSCSSAAPGDEILNGTYDLTNGVITVSGMNYNRPRDIYIRVSSSGLSNDCSTRVRVSVGSPVKLAFSVQPSATGVAAVNLKVPPKVIAQDAYDNTVTSYSTAVSLAAYSDVGCTTPAGGILDSSSSLSNGVTSFSGVRYSQTGDLYLQATSGALTPACSNKISLIPSVPMFFRGF